MQVSPQKLLIWSNFIHINITSRILLLSFILNVFFVQKENGEMRTEQNVKKKKKKVLQGN